MSYNIFGEKHGKNGRDQHFSVVSSFIRQESFLKKLTCCNDIVEAIHKNQKISNELREKKRLSPIITKAFIIDNPKNEFSYFRYVDHIKNYYNFSNDKKLVMKSTILSDLKDEHKVLFKDQIKKTEIQENQIELVNENENETINFENFNKKVLSIKF